MKLNICGTLGNTEKKMDYVPYIITPFLESINEEPFTVYTNKNDKIWEIIICSCLGNTKERNRT